MARMAVTCPSSGVYKNPVGLFLKPHQTGKFCMNVDLSAPHGFSINDNINVNLRSLEYTSVEQAAKLVKAEGQFALMGKLEL